MPPEPVIHLLSVALAALLLRPVLRRLPIPGWLARARQRGRPGVPVTAWLGAVVLSLVLWAIGERRGVAGGVLLALWILGPLGAAWITTLWVRRASHR